MPSALTFNFNFVSQQNDQLEQSTEHLSGCGVVLRAFLDRWTFVDEGRLESGVPPSSIASCVLVGIEFPVAKPCPRREDGFRYDGIQGFKAIEIDKHEGALFVSIREKRCWTA